MWVVRFSFAALHRMFSSLPGLCAFKLKKKKKKVVESSVLVFCGPPSPANWDMEATANGEARSLLASSHRRTMPLLWKRTAASARVRLAVQHARAVRLRQQLLIQRSLPLLLLWRTVQPKQAMFQSLLLEIVAASCLQLWLKSQSVRDRGERCRLIAS